MKTQEQIIEKLVAEYNTKIVLCEQERNRFIKIKNNIKEHHAGCPTKYEADFDYQDMIRDIAKCEGQIQAYTQAKHDIESILNFA